VFITAPIGPGDVEQLKAVGGELACAIQVRPAAEILECVVLVQR